MTTTSPDLDAIKDDPELEENQDRTEPGQMGLSLISPTRSAFRAEFFGI